LVKQDLPKLKTSPSEIALGSLRLLHLDAVHDHPSVLNDLRNFAPLMAPHGVLVLDDYFDPNWPGVSTAMTEFCLSDQGRNFRPFASSKSKMYLCRREWVDIYQKSIIESEVIAHLALELVLDGSVLRCYTNWPVSKEALLGHFDRQAGA